MEPTVEQRAATREATGVGAADAAAGGASRACGTHSPVDAMKIWLSTLDSTDHSAGSDAESEQQTPSPAPKRHQHFVPPLGVPLWPEDAENAGGSPGCSPTVARSLELVGHSYTAVHGLSLLNLSTLAMR